MKTKSYVRKQILSNFLVNPSALATIYKNVQFVETSSTIACKYIANQINARKILGVKNAEVTALDGGVVEITIIFSNGIKYLINIIHSDSVEVGKIETRNESSKFICIDINVHTFIDLIMNFIIARISQRLRGYEAEKNAHLALSKLKNDPTLGYHFLFLSKSTEERDTNAGFDFIIKVSEKILNGKEVDTKLANLICKTVKLNIKSSLADFDKHAKKFPDVFPILYKHDNQFRIDLLLILDTVFKKQQVVTEKINIQENE